MHIGQRSVLLRVCLIGAAWPLAGTPMARAAPPAPAAQAQTPAPAPEAAPAASPASQSSPAESTTFIFCVSDLQSHLPTVYFSDLFEQKDGPLGEQDPRAMCVGKGKAARTCFGLLESGPIQSAFGQQLQQKYSYKPAAHPVMCEFDRTAAESQEGKARLISALGTSAQVVETGWKY